MRNLVKTFASAALFVFLLALPAGADDFKLGIGGGATFPAGNFANVYDPGWNITLRALWLPGSSVVGLRGAGYYGQNGARNGDFPGVGMDSAQLYGFDADLALRLTGHGAEGLYAYLGGGVRALRQGVHAYGQKFSQTDTGASGNAGLGWSAHRWFVEANAVYSGVQGTGLWSFPVTVGFQF
ncbi:MAG TPA: hypothetical protein PLB02_05890 [Thermoanaerobaculia bacterium]|nr:hypothetical protein [Thermoanaerobaculia bacterium]HQR66907.1 hypothetical protein [Thermoanaerobaculia bacterium]